MKHFLGLLFIITNAFTSCEGRKTSHQALAESIEEFKKTASLEVDVFIPESYSEKEVDTVLHNGFKVKIKTFTDLEHSVDFSKIKDTINYQTHYRNFKFEISIINNDKVIYNEHFNKERVNKDFNKSNNTKEGLISPNFDKLAVLKSIQINDDPSLINNVKIDILYTIPESDKHFGFTLVVDDKGRSNILHVN